jgi:hypothetical protein
MVPLFNDEFFNAVSDSFNGCHDVGIAFNSYDPAKGLEIVHLNARAQQILGKRPADQSLHRPRTIYAAITPQNVRDGLWVYQYGFDASSMLDGAFYRQIMLWETRFARDVFVARPIKHSWIGTLPSSYIEMEDVKAEITFNGAYQGERDKIMLMNRLIEKNLITDPAFHTVDLHEIEMETQETFFDYVFEDVRLFDRAHARGKDALAAYIGDRRAAA